MLLRLCFSFQVRSPYPMIPIGGIQMVHSIPTSVTTPLSQQGTQQAASRLVLQKSTSEDSTTSDVSYYFGERGRREGVGGERESSSQEKDGGVVIREQEESIQTCTKAIASLCIDSEESVERGRGGGGRGDEGKDGGRGPPSSSPPSVLSPNSEPQKQQQRSPSISMSPSSSHPSPPPPQGPGIQHFSSLELRPPHPSIPASPHSSSSPSSPHPHSPGSDTLQPPTVSKPLKLERDREAGSTDRTKDVSWCLREQNKRMDLLFLSRDNRKGWSATERGKKTTFAHFTHIFLLIHIHTNSLSHIYTHVHSKKKETRTQMDCCSLMCVYSTACSQRRCHVKTSKQDSHMYGDSHQHDQNLLQINRTLVKRYVRNTRHQTATCVPFLYSFVVVFLLIFL